jgi:hypothetical protein
MGDGIVMTSYGISIHLDNERRLDSIGVKKWLTGW